MNKPKIDLKSEIVRIITPQQAGKSGDAPIYRHFFNWTFANGADGLPFKTSTKIPLRVQLYNAQGEPLGNLLAADCTPLGHRYLYVDAPTRAAGFGYHTVSLFKRSQECLDTIATKTEDLTKL